jgi:hypothetical protein
MFTIGDKIYKTWRIQVGVKNFIREDSEHLQDA